MLTTTRLKFGWNSLFFVLCRSWAIWVLTVFSLLALFGSFLSLPSLRIGLGD